MKKLVLIAAMLAVCWGGIGAQVTDEQQQFVATAAQISACAATFTHTDTVGRISATHQFEINWGTVAPSTTSITITPYMRGGTAGTPSTSSSTANQIISVVGIFDYYTIAITCTGAPTALTVNVTGTHSVTAVGGSVEINGTTCTNCNLQATTPAAPAGSINCIWQLTGSTASCYVTGTLTQTKIVALGSATAGNATANSTGLSCSNFSSNAPLWSLGGGGSNTAVFSYPVWVPGAGTMQVIDCTGVIPPSFGGTFTVGFDGVFDTVASDTVTLEAQAVCTSTSNYANPTFGTPGTVSPTMSGTPLTYVNTATFTVTPSGTCTAGNTYHIQFFRSTSDSGTGNASALFASVGYTGSY